MSKKDTSWLFPGYESENKPEQYKGNEEFRRQQKYLRKFLNKMMEGKEDENSYQNN